MANRNFGKIPRYTSWYVILFDINKITWQALCSMIAISDDDESTQTVSVFLEGEESTLKFIDIKDRKVDVYKQLIKQINLDVNKGFGYGAVAS